MKVAASAVDGRKGVDAIAVSDATADEVEEMKSELKTPESQPIFTKFGSKSSSIFKKSVAKTMLMTRINWPTGTRNVMLKIAGTMVVGDSASIDLAAADDEDEDDATREQAAARKKALLARKLDLKKKLRAHATSVGSESQRDIVKKQKSSVKDMYKLESDIGDSGRKKPRFMVTPQQRIPWDIFLCSLLGYISLTVPYRVGFGVEASGPLLYFEAAIDFCFLADVVVNFRTVIVEKDREIWNRRTIARNYFKSWFFIDLISSLPFDLLITASNGSGHGMLGPLTRAMKMFKFSKIAKILRVAKIAKLLRINKLLKSSPALEDFIEEARLELSLSLSLSLPLILALSSSLPLSLSPLSSLSLSLSLPLCLSLCRSRKNYSKPRQDPSPQSQLTCGYYIHGFTLVYIHIYIYIYTEREKERARERARPEPGCIFQIIYD